MPTYCTSYMTFERNGRTSLLKYSYNVVLTLSSARGRLSPGVFTGLSFLGFRLIRKDGNHGRK